MDAVDQNFAFKFAALAEIPPILCIEVISSSSQHLERNVTLKTFADNTG